MGLVVMVNAPFDFFLKFQMKKAHSTPRGEKKSKKVAHGFNLISGSCQRSAARDKKRSVSEGLIRR
jgi:hypothetical protein